MQSPASARIAAAAPAFVERASAGELADWLAYFEPDVVVLPGDESGRRAASALRRTTGDDTLVFDPGGHDPLSGSRRVGGVELHFAPTTDDLATVDPASTAFVLSGLLSLDVDRATLSTSLDGLTAYRDGLGPAAGDDAPVNLSVRLPAGYRREWEGLRVVGAGADAGVGDEPLVALDCRADGRVLERSLRRSTLGLRALDGVGETRARRLREAGFGSRAAVAEAGVAALAGLDGLGESSAERIAESARAVAAGEVVRRSDAPLPGGDPVFVDIETDGLSPTITWLVGVLEGSAEDGTYRSFVQRDPDDPGGAIREFLAWYDAEARGRQVVAYNGWTFDFPVLAEHVTEYCPEFEPVWDAMDRFDPYRWAVRDDNAVLPGRTNKLEDVAAALGHEPAETGLTGAAVARAYRAWMDDPSRATELDWDRFDAYCEDDVRALATVWTALAGSSRVVSETRSDRGADETTQGTLSDW
ncbi:ribonuclease H-like domain-containing protein [Haloarchaeobius litoreus]|uniref:Ribonuclease H-like domain-containing protein n=1 Tax=Haloarchaeobius litoreus TaxID=755306 RepID=A0ABD6DR71_9EURY|nr:ribonuclease H-like domain-containing protein [Haloarchaeobius litoreus]